jgi:two-component system, OmpR family, phosphate regulon sensor histidine kinase PhoR
MNSIKKNFEYSFPFLPTIFTVSVILLILFSLLFHSKSLEFLIAIILIIFMDFSLLYFIGEKRKLELDKIKEVINKIRTNSIESNDSIKMGTDLKRLEEEIKSMFLKTQNDITNLKKIEKYRTEFLGNVSHELRTPIFAIQGYLETLLEGALNDPNVNMNFLQKANNHTQNLNNLLNDLIDISMIESGQMIMSYRYFNILEFLESIVIELKPYVEKKNLELVLIPFNPVQLYGDRQRLKQVMVNLITNAIKYTETGKVEIGMIDEESFGKIYVKDTGIGISQSDAERIFERFYRVDKDRSRELGGTGLGLAIVKHIVEAHGSSVEISSTIGIGSTFSFRLKK